MPTPAQQINDQNPIPVTISNPTNGLFRDSGDFGSALYVRGANGVQSVNLLDPTLGLYTPGTSGAGSQATQAIQNLKSQYGIDWNSLPAFNVADRGNSPTGKYMGTLASLSGMSGSGSTTQVLNGPGTGIAPVPQGQTPMAPGETPATASPNLGANGQSDTSTGTPLGTPLTPAQLQAPQYTLPSTINSSNTQSTNPINYQQPVDTSGSTKAAVSALNASYQQQLATAEKLGPQDQQESDLVKSLMALNTQDANKAADQTAANTANGVDAAQATINSLTATQKQNLDAYNAAQLQSQQGEGVTTAVDQRQRDAVTKQYAIQSLATSALLAAAQGDLANAQIKANQAVAAVYDPIEAKIAAGKANLALMASDPATTNEEKTQAENVTAILNAQAAAVAQARSQATEVQKVAVTAASYTPNFVATSQYPTAAQALQAIQNAPDPVTAQQIATATGLTAPTVKTGTWSAPYRIASGDTVQQNSVTGEIKVIDAPAAAGTGTGTWSAPYTYQGNTVQRNSKTGELKVVGNAATGDTTNTTNNILNGVSSLSDVPTTDANYENVKSQLQQHGLYEATPPAWYVKAVNDKAGQNVLPNLVQNQWNAYTKKALGN